VPDLPHGGGLLPGVRSGRGAAWRESVWWLRPGRICLNQRMRRWDSRLARLDAEMGELGRRQWIAAMDSGHEILHRTLADRGFLRPIPAESAERILAAEMS